MDNKQKAGLNKKSFELNYNGGSLWAEHLDSMGEYEAEVIKKYVEDYKVFRRPSVSSFMIINLDETMVTDKITSCIVNSILACEKSFMKIVFVGVGRKHKQALNQIQREKGTLLAFMNDYEKAKEWLFKSPVDRS